MELTINDRLRNRKVTFFNSFKIGMKYNSIASTFSFDFYFDPEIFEHKEMACVGHYHLCQLSHNGELILTGQILSQTFGSSSIKELMSIGGYSLPGVLEDCQVPSNDAIDKAIAAGNLKVKSGSPIPYAPREANNLSLREIAERLLRPFGLSMVIDSSVADAMEKKFDETAAKPKDTIKHYLTELATQRNIVLSHDRWGRLVFTKANTVPSPILDINVPKGGIPGTTMRFTFDGQHIHSQITLAKQADKDNDNDGEITKTNPFVPIVFRPKFMVQSSGSDVDTDLAASNALAAELRHMTWTITLDRWDVNGTIIRPGNTITVTNPEIYLYRKTTLFIEAVDLAGDQKQLTATLHCVLPEVYNGKDPVYTWKGINLH